jgi:putative intracellular protease/amidase
MPSQFVHVFVFNTLSDWEIPYAAAGINSSTFQQRPGRYGIRTVGLTRAAVKTMGGITILPDMELADLSPSQSAMLILPGGESWDAGKNVEAIAKAKEFLTVGIPVAAICGATAALARAGVLDERRHTSNSSAYLQATGYRGAARYVDCPAVEDEGVITAAGTAPLEFAYEIFRVLDVFSPAVREAWFRLFKTGDAGHYEELIRAAQSDNESA